MKKESRKKKLGWYKNKGYLHLTNKISSYNEVKKIPYDTNKIAKHAFFPLLFYVKKQRKYKQVNIQVNGKVQKIRTHSYKQGGKVHKTVKSRPIHYATHIDAHIYAYYASQLLNRYETQLSGKLNEAIIAYRSIPVNDGSYECKGNIHFAHEVFEEIKTRKDCIVLMFDIKNFFSSLNHRKLKKYWSRLLNKKALPADHYNIFKSITRFSYIKKDDLRQKYGGFNEKKIAENKAEGVKAFFVSPQELKDAIQTRKIRVYKNQYGKYRKTKKGERVRELCGIPQGLPISSVLSNIYLCEFDKYIVSNVVSTHNAFYRRYSDDIIICSQQNYQEIKNNILAQIQEYDLEIQDSKTEVYKFVEDNHKILVYQLFNNKKIQKPLSYLGFEFYGNKTLIKSMNVARFYRKMKKSVRAKHRQIEKIKIKNDIENPVVYRKKLYKRYTAMGKKTYHNRRNSKRRGNFFTYSERASNIMKEKAIRKQMRNHLKILKNYMKKYDLL